MVFGRHNSMNQSVLKTSLRNYIGFFIFLMIILLNGCSSIHRKDGPPPYDVDVTCIPDAKPKREALAKYGNMPRYRVFGKNYYVLKTAKNYRERGVASWYGTMFHDQRTSSGERYNMLAMTAAHRTLPLPTYVEVTNLKNGKKVIVKVNDRGPFASDRIIDLSYVAAKKLGMLGHGTAFVDVRAISLEEAIRQPVILAHHQTKSKTWIASNKPIFIQVGAFKNRLRAERLKNRLIPVVTSPIEITHLSHTPNKLYRVKIGPMQDTIAADNLKKKLRAIGLTPTHYRA